jgi:ferritin-like protein
MAEELHAPYDRLSRKTISLHQAIRSLMEELEAVDWYRQRADDCSDAELRDILLHNMREEMEHACMVLEWLRRNNSDFAGQLETYLFSEGDITEVEENSESEGGRSDPGKVGHKPTPSA